MSVYCCRQGLFLWFKSWLTHWTKGLLFDFSKNVKKSIKQYKRLFPVLIFHENLWSNNWSIQIFILLSLAATLCRNSWEKQVISTLIYYSQYTFIFVQLAHQISKYILRPFGKKKMVTYGLKKSLEAILCFHQGFLIKYSSTLSSLSVWQCPVRQGLNYNIWSPLTLTSL